MDDLTHPLFFYKEIYLKLFDSKFAVLFVMTIFFASGCQQTTTVNSNSAMNHNAMNSENMNHSTMNHADHSQMKSAPGAANAPYDLQFLNTMIAYHQGAVDMAKEALQKAEHAEIKTLAQNIIKAKEAEIKQMRDWKSKWSK